MLTLAASTVLLSYHPARTAERPDVRFEQWKVPQSTIASPGGARSGPYSVAATDAAIWYTESEVQPNVLVRFDLKSETMQTWPVPSRGSVVRHMVAMGDSMLWLACSGTGVVVRARVTSSDQER